MATAARLPDLRGLTHALGPATDTAAYLSALTGRSGPALQAAIEHLDTAIVPGGRACAATPPVAGHVLGLLLDGAVPDPAIRVELLYFLDQVTEAAEAPADEPGVAGCRGLLTRILSAAEHCERDRDSDVRIEAADCAEAALEVAERLGAI